MRPSMMWVLPTPSSTASTQQLTLGIMPPVMVPSLIRSGTRATSMVEISRAVLSLDPLDVGEQDQLLGAQRPGDAPGHQVGIDVVGLARQADADRGDDRDEVALLQGADDLRVDALHLADHGRCR